MDDVERAAIILLGMGEAAAAEVLKHMEQKQVERVVMAMTELSHVAPEAVTTTLSDFLTASQKETSLGVGSTEYIRTTLVNALGKEKATNIIDRTLSELTGIKVLNWQEPATICHLIREEHPQIAAVILTHLDSEKSAAVLSLLNKDEREELMRRIATMGAVSPQALHELNVLVEQESKDLRGFTKMSIAGVKSAAKIIGYFDNDLEKEVMDTLSQLDGGLGEEIKEHIFPFEKLAEIDARSIQTLLREVSNENLVLALKGVDESIQQIFFSNMSERAAEMLKDDIEAKGPVQLSKVIAAQKEVVQNAQALAKEGKIVLAGQGEEMV